MSMRPLLDRFDWNLTLKWKLLVPLHSLFGHWRHVCKYSGCLGRYFQLRFTNIEHIVPKHIYVIRSFLNNLLIKMFPLLAFGILAVIMSAGVKWIAKNYTLNSMLRIPFEMFTWYSWFSYRYLENIFFLSYFEHKRILGFLDLPISELSLLWIWDRSFHFSFYIQNK